MIIVLKAGASEAAARELLEEIEGAGLRPLYMPGTERVVIGALGDERVLGRLHLEGHPAVESVKPILSPYTLASRELHPHDTLVDVDGLVVGGGSFVVVAGPCSVEGREQITAAAGAVAAAGARGLRGGAFKPRTNPYSFQGLGEEGLELLRDAAAETGLASFTEVVEAVDVELVERYASALQIGARNMQNFRLLQAVGRSRKPVLLKRGMAATVDDLLNAAEYILSEGNPNVILCERGITTFETATRNTLDLSAVPLIKQRSHLPVIVDPSHGTGLRELVTPMALAAAAAGADGLIVEVHPDPAHAWSDGRQSLDPEGFAHLMDALAPVVAAVGRTL